MKKLPVRFFVPLFAVCIITINGCKKEAPISIGKHHAEQTGKGANNINAKPVAGNITVAGGGSFEELGDLTTYDFNAVQQNNGTTKGHFLFHFRAADASMYVELDCIRLFGDNQATMSGIITRIFGKGNPDFPPPPFIYVGGRVSFTVQDNGEGNSASSDLVSDIGQLEPGVQASCEDEHPVYLAGVNVQINK